MKGNSMRVGVHTSIAGGVENAVHHARKIGCDTFQIFSANPRGWKTLDPTPEDCERFREARTNYGLAPVVIHDNYLINLASADSVIRNKSVAAFRRELRRAVALGADFVVTHPGSAKGASPSRAIRTCAESLLKAARDIALHGVTILIENTAGQGESIGRTFEEVAEIIAGASKDLPMGACIDTAHCFEAGYAVHTEEGLAESVRQLDSTIGLGSVRVIHANDSKTPFGSHADRHEHIGKGHIGREAFRRIVCHPKLMTIPFICETPIDRPGDDRRNIRMMRKLAGMIAVSPQSSVFSKLSGR
ncbi:MAG TPA: deoxyribonuclease IV [Terriglobia bacterium]|nr:deoxyribonuclease IV [Terriglobia bacterium]